MIYRASSRIIESASGLASTDVGRVAQFSDAIGNPYSAPVLAFISETSVILSLGTLPTGDIEIFNLVVNPVTFTIDLRRFTLDDVATRTALLARVKQNDDLATAPDDDPALFIFFDEAVLRIATLCNLITNLTPSANGLLDIPMYLMPRRLWTALSLFVMEKWFKNMGEIELGKFFEDEYKNQVAVYRFNPDKPTVTTRPYRAF